MKTSTSNQINKTHLLFKPLSLSVLAALLLSLSPATGQAKTLFSATTQDVAALKVELTTGLLGGMKVSFRGDKLKVIKKQNNVLVALKSVEQEQQLVLITGNVDEVDQGLEQFFWGQTFNLSVLQARLALLQLGGECSIESNVFKGVIFEFSQPDNVGSIACLK